MGSEWAFLLMSECAQGFLQDYRTFIATILLIAQLCRHCIGAINLTALVTPPSKTGFHQTIEQRLRQIQIQFKQCSTTLLASKQKNDNPATQGVLWNLMFLFHTANIGAKIWRTQGLLVMFIFFAIILLQPIMRIFFVNVYFRFWRFESHWLSFRSPVMR